MARFYHHPKTSMLHFQAIAGGHGGGATSEFDAPATEADIRNFPSEHARYMEGKRAEEVAIKAAHADSAKRAEIKAEIEADTEKL